MVCLKVGITVTVEINLICVLLAIYTLSITQRKTVELVVVSYSLVQSILSMTSSSCVTSDQVVLFQINKSCCGDRGLGRWFNAAYTAGKFLHRNLQIIIFLPRINLKRMGDRCETEHEDQWCGRARETETRRV